MRAKVKADYRFQFIKAFGGVDFSKREYTPIPTGYEDDARQHPFLEIEDPAPEPTPAQAIQPEPTPRKRRKGAAND